MVLVNTVCRSVQAFLALELFRTLLYVDCKLQIVLLQAVVSDITQGMGALSTFIHERAPKCVYIVTFCVSEPSRAEGSDTQKVAM